MTSSTSATPDRRPGLFVLIAISVIGPFGVNILLPSLPSLQQGFQTDYGSAQLTITLYLAALAVGQLVIGPVSDRFGRRPVVLIGLAAYLLAALGCMVAASIGQLLVLRVIQAAGGCAGLALARAIVRDLHERTKAASMIGYITMSWVTIQVFSPTLGGVVDEWAGWRANFLVTAALGAIVLALAWFRLHETLQHRGASFGIMPLVRNCVSLLKQPVFIGYAFNAAFANGIFFAFAAGTPFVAITLMGLSPAEYGLWIVLSTGGYMAGNFLSGRLAQRTGAHALILAGAVSIAVGLAAIIYSAAVGLVVPIAFFGAQAIVALGNGLTVPSALAGALSVNPRIAGAAAGLCGFLQMGAGALASLMISLLHDGTSFPMIAAMTVSGVISLGAFAVALVSLRRG